jgi:hypothetical protein
MNKPASSQPCEYPAPGMGLFIYYLEGRLVSRDCIKALELIFANILYDVIKTSSFLLRGFENVYQKLGGQRIYTGFRKSLP